MEQKISAEAAKKINKALDKNNIIITGHLITRYPYLGVSECYEIAKIIRDEQMPLILEVLDIVNEFCGEIKSSQNPSVRP